MLPWHELTWMHDAEMDAMADMGAAPADPGPPSGPSTVVTRVDDQSVDAA